MILGDLVEPIRAVRREHGIATASEPLFAMAFRLAGSKHHQFVIAAERDQVPAGIAFDQPFDYATGVGATIDIVAKRDDAVIRREGSELCEDIQRSIATVNVADRKCSHVGLVSVSVS